MTKQKLCFFSTSRTAEYVHFLYNEKEIETVTGFNYLIGVTFTKNGKFKLAKQKNIEKATKAMYEVIRRGKIHNLSIECLLDLFDKIVKPILLHGCEVWGFSDYYVIEKKSFEILQINTSLEAKHAKLYDIRRAWSLSTLHRYTN